MRRFDDWSTSLRRRDFIKALAKSSVGAALSGSLIEGPDLVRAMGVGGQLKGPHPAADPFYASHVRPLIGTGWHGHAFPGPTAPFGLVQMGPDTSGPKVAWYNWDHSAGYHYKDSEIDGFSHTHVQGTGGGELGDVLLMPVVGGLNWAWDKGAPGKGYCSAFSHGREEVRAGYYRVFLETPRVQAELTATLRCGMHRYTYPAASEAGSGPCGFLLDLVHGLESRAYHAELNLEGPTTISGCRYTRGWAENRQAYFVIEFSPSVLTSVEVMVDRKPAAADAKHYSGKEIKARFACRPG